MKLMLDTGICIYLIKQHPPSVLERFLSHPVGDIGISSITVAELDYGVSKSLHARRIVPPSPSFSLPSKLHRSTEMQPPPMGDSVQRLNRRGRRSDR